MSSLTDRAALVVGGTSGIGAAVAEALAARGAHVTVAGRTVEAGEAVVRRMREAAPGSEAAHRFARLDASSLRQTREFAAARGDAPLDFLVMCQSTASFGGRRETDEGLELKLVLHAYSRFVLSEELLPALRRGAAPGGAGRVLSVLSGGVHGPFTDWDDADLRRSFSLKRAADAAGFYNDLAFQRMADAPENADVGFLHAAPGFVASSWGHQTKAAPLIKIAQRLFAAPASACAEVMVGALTDPRFAAGFHCVSPRGEPAKTTRAHTPENMDALARHLEQVYAELD